MIYNTHYADLLRPCEVDYLTFTSANSMSITPSSVWTAPLGATEYSLDGGETWNSWTSGAITGTVIKFRGMNVSEASDTDKPWVIEGSDVYCSGDIETVRGYNWRERGYFPPSVNMAYANMFKNCTALVSCPELTCPEPNYHYYYGMFWGCSNLTTLPTLSATTITNYCYYCMFNGCSKIKLSEIQTGEYQTPYRIPSSGTGTIGTGALNNMFYGTGGTFTGTPSVNTTYYTSNEVI